MSLPSESRTTPVEITGQLQHLLNAGSLELLENLLAHFALERGKKSFLVFKNNRYINIPTEQVAYFYIKFEMPMILCFDKQEYFVNHSLDQLQQLLPANQFFRLNRQYLINFAAVRDAEHYFARKLLVNLLVPVKDKLLVPSRRVTDFLQWLYAR